ncbi:MAG TPA: cytochrome c peroxidase [Polyangiaceae bacterium]|nr:cytochrome c peroxidase [Polyangiaceae bacterium]
MHRRRRQRGRHLRQHSLIDLKNELVFLRHLATGAALFFAAACGKRTPAPAPKPAIAEAWSAAKIPKLPRSPIIPARRTNVLPEPPRAGPPDDPVLVALGKKIFFDERLSEPAGTSCASCHDPARAFSGGHGSRVGVPQGSRPGHFARRSTPSVLYMRYVPKFYYFEDDEAPAPEPRGGYFWDGRADSLVELVQQPLFNPDEMNAGNARTVAGKIARAPYAKEFTAALGAAATPDAVLHDVGVALEAFLKSDEMTPHSSKYDAYVRGEATLTEQERHGLELFKDRRHGACSGCHRLAETSTNPAESMFTDYGYDAVALPRNRDLPANEDAGAFDLGLCKRDNATTPSTDERFCSNFRTPSLRNVAVRESFGHNGYYKKLRDVVAFYALRAVAPGRIYPPGQKWDDVPPKYFPNVNIYAPIYNQREGATPPLSDEDIDAIVAFLKTLTDAPFAATVTDSQPIARSPAP